MTDHDAVTDLLDAVSRILLGAFGLGMLFVMLWVAVFSLFGDFVHVVHGAFFAIARERFDAIHYAGMACTKGVLFLGFLFPALAIRWELRRRRG